MRNPPAFWSVVVGLLALAALPAAIAYADWSGRLELISAGAAVPVTLLLGLVAVGLARRGEQRAQLTLLRRSGSASARLGKILGTLALLVGGAGLTALVVYFGLTYRGGT